MQSASATSDVSFEELLRNASGRLWKQAPAFTKVIFANCEFHDGEGGMALSDDCFAVVKPPFFAPTRHQVNIDADAFLLLTQAARIEMASEGQARIVVDLILRKGRSIEFFVSPNDGVRLTGQNRSFRERHKVYAAVEPLLSQI